MNEKHTITATLNFGDHEIDVTLKVEANYTPAYRGTLYEPPESEGYEVWSIKLKDSDDLTSAMAEYLLSDLDGRREGCAEEAAEARRDALREVCPVPTWPAVERCEDYKPGSVK